VSAPSPQAQIVAGLRACDSRAFTDAYELYADRLYSFAVRLAGRRDAAEELFQHAWLRLAERAPRLADDTNLLAWLLTVARNRWRSQRRKIDTHGRHEHELWDAVAAEPPPDVSLERRTALAKLEAALSDLAEHHREVLIVMIEADDVPQHQLAAVLGVSPAVFRKRLSRARAALSALLRQQEPSP
jgi:RNA polymerase sigma-70 factor (ECF subfamily)